VRPFRVILREQGDDVSKLPRTTTFVVPLDRAPDNGSTLELPQGLEIVVKHVLSGGSDGMAGTVIAAPA
jgi:hypothetical protein